MSKEQIVWKHKSEPEDYEGARNFLTLIFPEAKSEFAWRFAQVQKYQARR